MMQKLFCGLQHAFLPSAFSNTLPDSGKLADACYGVLYRRQGQQEHGQDGFRDNVRSVIK